MAVRYVCTTKCFHNLRLYRVGDYADFTKASEGPKNKKGALIHFEPVDDGQDNEAPKIGVRVNEKAI